MYAIHFPQHNTRYIFDKHRISSSRFKMKLNPRKHFHCPRSMNLRNKKEMFFFSQMKSNSVYLLVICINHSELVPYSIEFWSVRLMVSSCFQHKHDNTECCCQPYVWTDCNCLSLVIFWNTFLCILDQVRRQNHHAEVHLVIVMVMVAVADKVVVDQTKIVK